MAVPETFKATLWSAISPPAPPAVPLSGERRADVAVIGAGILGLSLTLHLARRGIDVVLLEADEPGFGASGRNTGFVVPSFPAGRGPADAARLLGAERGERLVRFAGGSAARLFALVAAEAIDCSAEPNGWLQPAPTAEAVARLEERARQWQAFGQPVRILGRTETEQLTGSRSYAGALIDDSGGQINPLAYVRGLARAAVKAGAAIHAASRVTQVLRQAGLWRIETAGGHVLADQVFATTNALVGPLLPKVRRSIIPARPYQVATQPLDEAVRARILPKRQPLADVHRHTFAVRWSPDNRLVTGGLAVLNNSGAVERMARYFLGRLHRYLPGLPQLEAAHAWSGVVATTREFLPEIWSIGPGFHAPIACNGRGVAMTTAMGAALAEFAATGDADALPVPITAPRPHSFPGLIEHGPSLWLAWNSFRDAIDDRHAGIGKAG
jgi:glycine/D-amino acid oxidase-like deaminating enzyme